MTLRRLLITAANRRAFEGLQVHDTQRDLVAPNTAWLDRILGTNETQTMGILYGDTPVGLYSITDTRRIPPSLMTAYFRAGHSYLWHFMIDAAAQGRGLGRAALRLIDQHAADHAARGISLTTGDTRAGNALGFYRAAGYAPTGRRLHDELELVKHLEDPHHA